MDLLWTSTIFCRSVDGIGRRCSIVFANTLDWTILVRKDSPLGHQGIGFAQSAKPDPIGFFPLAFPPQGCNPFDRADQVLTLGIRCSALTAAFFRFGQDFVCGRDCKSCLGGRRHGGTQRCPVECPTKIRFMDWRFINNFGLLGCMSCSYRPTLALRGGVLQFKQAHCIQRCVPRIVISFHDLHQISSVS